MKVNPRQVYYKKADLDLRNVIGEWWERHQDLHYSEIISIIANELISFSREQMKTDWKEYES